MRTSREAIIRYKNELHSLQKEKRELMKQINQLNAQLRLKLSLFDGEMVEYKLNYSNTSEPYTITNRNSKDDEPIKKGPGSKEEGQFKQIMHEKDKYISKMEEENGRLRIENEELKDKLIQCEIDDIGRRAK